MDSPRLSRDVLAFLIGVPLAWAVLLLFHPSGDGEQLYQDLEGNVTAMLVVHIGTMIFIPLIAAAVYLLLRGVEGTAAQVSRIALPFFVVFYGVWEALQGIATAILAHEVNALSGSAQATGAALIQDFGENPLASDFGIFSSIGSLALIVALIAAGVALRHLNGVPLSVPILLGISGFLITAHPPPFGPTGLVLFTLAVVLYARSQSSARVQPPIRQPRPA
jgi:hypothetical protein